MCVRTSFGLAAFLGVELQDAINRFLEEDQCRPQALRLDRRSKPVLAADTLWEASARVGPLGLGVVQRSPHIELGDQDHRHDRDRYGEEHAYWAERNAHGG